MRGSRGETRLVEVMGRDFTMCLLAFPLFQRIDNIHLVQKIISKQITKTKTIPIALSKLSPLRH
jgi:hypothetical protein